MKSGFCFITALGIAVMPLSIAGGAFSSAPNTYSIKKTEFPIESCEIFNCSFDLNILPRTMKLSSLIHRDSLYEKN